MVWTGVVTTALTAFGENYAMKSLSAAESTVRPTRPSLPPPSFLTALPPPLLPVPPCTLHPPLQVIYSTEPLWGTAFAAVALHEHVGPNTFVGAALILGACVWSSVGPTLSFAGLATALQVIHAPLLSSSLSPITHYMLVNTPPPTCTSPSPHTHTHHSIPC